MKTLIIGGVRSGKSRLAESLASKTGLPVTVIATATPSDEEMRARIAAHRAHRPAEWTVIEEPRALAQSLSDHAQSARCVIVDCLTLWLTNLLLSSDSALFERERAALISLLPSLPGEILMVTNETNLGIIPMSALARRFGDEAGRLHQELGQIGERVVFTVAGFPLALKGGL